MIRKRQKRKEEKRKEKIPCYAKGNITRVTNQICLSPLVVPIYYFKLFLFFFFFRLFFSFFCFLYYFSLFSLFSSIFIFILCFFAYQPSFSVHRWGISMCHKSTLCTFSSSAFPLFLLQFFIPTYCMFPYVLNISLHFCLLLF